MCSQLSFHICSRDEAMSVLANEMQIIARSAAEPAAIGDSIKAEMVRAWQALSRPPWWRLKAAWYGEAGCWSGRAIEEFRARHKARLAKEEAARAKASAIASLCAAAADRLETIDPDFHRPEIDRLRRMVGDIGAQNSAVAPGGRSRK